MVQRSCYDWYSTAVVGEGGERGRAMTEACESWCRPPSFRGRSASAALVAGKRKTPVVPIKSIRKKIIRKDTNEV